MAHPERLLIDKIHELLTADTTLVSFCKEGSIKKWDYNLADNVPLPFINIDSLDSDSNIQWTRSSQKRKIIIQVVDMANKSTHLDMLERIENILCRTTANENFRFNIVDNVARDTARYEGYIESKDINPDRTVKVKSVIITYNYIQDKL